MGATEALADGAGTSIPSLAETFEAAEGGSAMLPLEAACEIAFAACEQAMIAHGLLPGTVQAVLASARANVDSLEKESL